MSLENYLSIYLPQDNLTAPYFDLRLWVHMMLAQNKDRTRFGLSGWDAFNLFVPWYAGLPSRLM